MAKKALMKAIVNRESIDTAYPFEEIVLTCGGRKSVGDTAAKISRWRGYKAARRYYSSKKTGARIQDADFDLVYWEGMGRVMKRYPKMYRVWATKQTAGVCGCNEHLSKFDKKVKNVCPSCGVIGESVAHVAICDDPGRKELFLGSVDELTEWMTKSKTEPTMAKIIELYLRARGSRKMSDCVSGSPSSWHTLLAKYQDRLGWQNFIEGRFVSIFVQIQRRHLETSESWNTAESWATGLME